MITPPRSGVSWVARVEPWTKIVVVGATVGAEGGCVVAVVAGARVVGGDVVTDARGASVGVAAVVAVVDVVVVTRDVEVVAGRSVVVVGGSVGAGGGVGGVGCDGSSPCRGTAAAVPCTIAGSNSAAVRSSVASAGHLAEDLTGSPGTSRRRPRRLPPA